MFDIAFASDTLERSLCITLQAANSRSLIFIRIEFLAVFFSAWWTFKFPLRLRDPDPFFVIVRFKEVFALVMIKA